MCKELSVYLGFITWWTQKYVFVPSTYLKIWFKDDQSTLLFYYNVKYFLS
jgi:hypothetical protein